jgi:polar amino acid transport system substrate-binding protein
MTRQQIPLLGAVAVVLAIIAAVLLTRGTGEPTPTQTATTPVATPTQAAETTPEPTADACATENLATKTPGTLTIGTDNPAFPPYFEGREGENSEPWDPEWGDPTTGKGFESATAYAIAEELGFTADAVSWIAVRFNRSFAPGPKDFDFFINQVTFNPERAENADLSEGYYFGNQTVVVMEDSEFAGATTITELQAAELGAQVGTTSLATIEEVIQTTQEAGVYDSTDDALEAMQNGNIDGVVVDLPTADFITNVQVDGSVIVGQIGEAAGAQPEHFSLVLELDSPLTDCVNSAIAALDADGTLDALTNEWLPFSTVPELQP